MEKYNPVTLSIFWDKLISIADESFASMIRSSFSPIVRDAMDCVSMIFDKTGRSVAQAWSGPPSFIGTLPFTLSYILEEFPAETLKPGDALALNDPWMGTGHLNDFSVVEPVFYDDELIAFSGTVSHLPDIGGIMWSAVARSVYEEGLWIPPIKLMEEGERNEDVFRIIRQNVRAPHQVIGDIMSNITACTVGGALITQFIKEYKIPDFYLLASQIVNKTEEAIKSEVRKMPKGEYVREFDIEGYEEPHRIVCSVEIKGEEIVIDYEGTSEQAERGYNSPIPYTRSYSLYGLKSVIDPNTPNNYGTITPFTVKAPLGCILNPEPPAACAARHRTGWFTSIAVWGALAQAVPDRVPAEPGLFAPPAYTGIDAKGQSFAATASAESSGGTGAHSDGDGINTTGSPTVVANTPVEIVEATWPLFVETRTLRPDSGGPGKYRGGLGGYGVTRIVNPSPIRIAFKTSRFEFPACGISDGKPGSIRELYINDERVHGLHMYVLKQGDKVIQKDAGGGGFGDPFERDIEMVVEDVKNGFVSLKAAKEQYGVVIDIKTWKAHRIPKKEYEEEKAD